MTRITIDLDEDEVDAARFHLSNFCQTTQDGPLTRTFEKLLAALPPEQIEPKAGGTCRARSESRVRTILGINEQGVWLSGMYPEGFTVDRKLFNRDYEVLT